MFDLYVAVDIVSLMFISTSFQELVSQFQNSTNEGMLILSCFHFYFLMTNFSLGHVINFYE